ncbi:MAG: Asp-tRNA(Asn)/Glu-tRNA(Gln) amidotransferase subunit GatC [Pseudomonadota bacterium]
MSVDHETVRRAAKLARIAVTEEEVAPLVTELNGILDWIEQLSEVDVEGVEPMTTVTPMRLKRRQDAVTDGGYPEQILANAPEAQEGFFVVPKVVE